MLSLKNLTYRQNQKTLLNDISVQTPNGTLVGLIGENGAGKTTLLRVLSGYLKATSGSCSLKSVNLMTLPAPQRPALLSYFSTQAVSIWGQPVADVLSLTEETSLKTSLTQYLDVYPLLAQSFESLSSGEKQRVLLCLALSMDVPLYLLDEPLSFLDPRHQLKVMHLLKKKAQEGKLVLLSCHDVRLVQRFCHQAWVLRKGSLLEAGPVSDVLTPTTLEAVYGLSLEELALTASPGKSLKVAGKSS